MSIRILSLLASLALSCLPALADDWVAVKLKGAVEQYVDGAWVTLGRGDVVSDNRLIRTLADGRVDFQRDEEIIGLGPETQIRIEDRASESYTTVQQDRGTVEIEAEVEAIEHFEVKTKFLAAVVKGTHFIVTSTDAGGTVSVTRGLVAVEDRTTSHRTVVAVGQVASIRLGSEIQVSGEGTLPAILDATGRPLSGGTVDNGSANLGTGGPGLATDQAGTAPLRKIDIELQAGKALPPLKVSKREESEWLPIGIVVGAGILLGGVALLFRRIFG